jgi:hypothetical protein
MPVKPAPRAVGWTSLVAGKGPEKIAEKLAAIFGGLYTEAR